MAVNWTGGTKHVALRSRRNFVPPVPKSRSVPSADADEERRLETPAEALQQGIHESNHAGHAPSRDGDLRQDALDSPASAVCKDASQAHQDLTTGSQDSGTLSDQRAFLLGISDWSHTKTSRTSEKVPSSRLVCQALKRSKIANAMKARGLQGGPEQPGNPTSSAAARAEPKDIQKGPAQRDPPSSHHLCKTSSLKQVPRSASGMPQVQMAPPTNRLRSEMYKAPITPDNPFGVRWVHPDTGEVVDGVTSERLQDRSEVDLQIANQKEAGGAIVPEVQIQDIVVHKPTGQEHRHDESSGIVYAVEDKPTFALRQTVAQKYTLLSDRTALEEVSQSKPLNNGAIAEQSRQTFSWLDEIVKQAHRTQ
ncbi:hypothetical protein IE81DRAFT_241471 [Ceraceosorus guamensis]|uniref:Uncharacterized protein n=1 Tax=Ceraceosorus guamensis TaxID=1522189 RepID=A0A316W4R3_9BASI|nr:hypothetical protein IE81DRAFT_241471 [Ceraceosorus guamensis]PWN44870.1 hypothetical protein IE81DRAFT_241471 [Ceraceosorus guamensis]